MLVTGVVNNDGRRLLPGKYARLNLLPADLQKSRNRKRLLAT